ncbi:MAG: hypothetical protein HN472_13500 [Nitrospina sp.]|nr:hypothetical protein [Nitrospina sp.]MBT3510548.1 hypothetical protein [Nitrospina sp.]MBT3874502.1 hypothetical protein [Nitrospina sp.]MBT4049895.1 hypothetical protein [Nitrospina sp.]MBT4557839.1 hypothetical protein [Nitrospina sp.]
MRKFWRVFGWIFLGIFLQFKFNALYGIVFLENLNFHDRSYWVEMSMTPTEESLRILKVKTTVHHSLGPDYFANIYIPNHYKVLNEMSYAGAEALPGYQAFKMDMKRKYRDVLSEKHFIIAPQKLDEDIPEKPISVHFENLKQRLHSDQTYLISTTKNKTQLEGPKMAEATYPQKLGM